MSIFDGLEKLGLGHMKDADVYSDTPKEVPKFKAPEKKVEEEVKESDFTYIKVFDCPVCEKKFKYPVLKTGKDRLVKQDKDLRPVHKYVDSAKYDVINCNNCGYAVLPRYYGPLAKPHKDMLREAIAAHYKPMFEVGETVTYGQAYTRFKLALANAVARHAKDSEKALICLRTAWLVRGMQEHPDEIPDKEEFSMDNLKVIEQEYLKEAMNGFIKARESERPPIAGMNEVTLDYLLAVLCLGQEDFENAIKLAQSIISSSQAGSAQKDKARELMLEIKESIKKKKAMEAK